MAFFDGKGNSIEVTAKLPSRLNGADVIWFGDSNIFNSAGHTLADLGSWYERLEAEFGLNGWVNNGVNGMNTYQVSVKFAEWATAEKVAKYNKESTFLLFWCGTNDKAEKWFEGETATLDYVQHIQNISQIIEEKFPEAFYAFFIPPATMIEYHASVLSSVKCGRLNRLVIYTLLASLIAANLASHSGMIRLRDILKRCASRICV